MDMMDKLLSHPKRLDSRRCQGDVLPSPKLQLQAAEDSDSEVEILLK